MSKEILYEVCEPTFEVGEGERLRTATLTFQVPGARCAAGARLMAEPRPGR
ncbi:hypothetical protein ACMHYB_55370 [Sorangium sp. So ce1128]